MLIDCHVHCGLGQLRELSWPDLDDLVIQMIKDLIQSYQNNTKYSKSFNKIDSNDIMIKQGLFAKKFPVKNEIRKIN